MTEPTFTAPPTAPSRSDPPATFVSRADAFVAWFSTFRTELVAGVGWIGDQVDTMAEQAASITTAVTNGLASIAADLADALSDISAALTNANTVIDARVLAAGWSGTSTSSVAVGTGSKTFTTQTNKAFVVGARLIIAETAAPTARYMIGQVTAYNAGTGSLTVNVTDTLGSGTVSAWTIGLTGQTGPAGPLPDQASVAEIIAGTNDTKYTSPKDLLDSLAWSTVDVNGAFTPDFATAINFNFTMTGNGTMGVPTNMTVGQAGFMRFLQPSVGGKTLAKNASIRVENGTMFTLSTANNAQDVCSYLVLPGPTLVLFPPAKGLA
jgi:hypothetical protein